MKINIKRSDCKFIVKPEDKMVICIIDRYNGEGLKYTLLDFIRMEAPSSVDLYPYSKLMEKLEMPTSFIGKAVCSPDDEWNEEIGKKIAYSRAKNKFYTSFYKRANIYVQAVDNALNNLITKFNDLGAALEENKKKLDEEIEPYLAEKE